MKQDQRVKYILEMLQSNPEDDFLNYAAALEFKKAQDHGKSIELLDNLLQRNENYLPAYYQLGKLHELSGDAVKAQKVYGKGVKIAEMQQESKTLAELKEALGQFGEEQENG